MSYVCYKRNGLAMPHRIMDWLVKFGELSQISLKLSSSTVIFPTRLDLLWPSFVSWWMWFNGSSTKALVSFSHECILLPSYVYNMHQDTKSARLIAVCKRTLTRWSTPNHEPLLDYKISEALTGFEPTTFG